MPHHRAQPRPQDAALHVLPTLWFRNTWSWRAGRPQAPPGPASTAAHPVVRAEHHELGVFYLHAEPGADLLFCENETNTGAAVGRRATATRYPKDGIADHVLHGTATVNPAGEGTKAAAHVRLVVPAGGAGGGAGAAHPRGARTSSPRRSPTPTS